MNVRQLKSKFKLYFKEKEQTKWIISMSFNIFSFKFDALRLSYSMSSEFYCVQKISNGINKGKWEVFFQERDTKSYLKYFTSEDEACDYFFNWIIDTTHSVTFWDNKAQLHKTDSKQISSNFNEPNRRLYHTTYL